MNARFHIAVVLASVALLGCGDRSSDDDGLEMADDGPDTAGDESPTPEPDIPALPEPDPSDECANPDFAGMAVWPCSGEPPEPFQDEPCVWDGEMETWSCFDYGCAQNTERGAELGLDPDVWVCEPAPRVQTCTFDPFGEEEPFDCPEECVIEDFFMTCPDFECEYDSVEDIWTCY